MNTSTINQNIFSYKQILLHHSLYEKVKTIEDLHQFLENHVYAVWDFMSLLKALQSKLTCTTTPWFATKNPETRYLINEIVLAEETDLTIDGKRLSHFEMYVDAMQSCGASLEELNDFLQDVVETKNVFIAIKKSNLHPNVKAFLDAMRLTWQFLPASFVTSAVKKTGAAEILQFIEESNKTVSEKKQA